MILPVIRFVTGHDRLAIALLVLMAGGSVAHAGSVSGSIADVVSPTVLTIVNTQIGKTTRVRTNAKGSFNIFLPPGEYLIKTEKGECGTIRSFDVPVRRDIKCP